MAISPERTIWRSFKRRLPIQQTPEDAHFRIHETAAQIRSKLGPDRYNSLHSFAVVRNPFDHAVSHFEYMKQYRSKKIARRFEGVDFLTYLKMRAAPLRPWQRIFVHLPDQAYFLVDDKNQLIVDRILKYETLSEDLLELQNHLQIEAAPLTKRNVTKSRVEKASKLKDYYGPAEVELLHQVYAKDFALFGYDTNLPTS